MNLVERIVGPPATSRETLPLSFDQFLSYFSSGGFQHNLLGGVNTTYGNEYEEMSGDYLSLVHQGFKRNGIVFACILVRMLVFKEARFRWRDISQGRPGKLFGTAELAPLERPWTNGTTSDLLARAELDGSIAGNFYAARRLAPRRRGQARGPDKIKRMRPDWTTIVLGSDGIVGDDPFGLDSEVVGYLYQPGGPSLGAEPIPLLADEVAHFAPIPDPEAMYRGMSWLSPIIDEMLGDLAQTKFKTKYMNNAATPNMVVTMDIADPEKFQHWVKLFRDEHEGVANAYRTLFLKAGMDAKPIGANLKEIEYSATQSGGEVRIASAAGVPPSIVGLSESLKGSALSQGNYQGARRRFSDGTMRPLWRDFCGSMQAIMDVPKASELWYDALDIPFLAEDELDAAEIQSKEASTVNTLVTAGFTPASAVDAVVANDLNLLDHTGLVSVQLLDAAPPSSQSQNGATPATDAAAASARAAQIVQLMRNKPSESERKRSSDMALAFIKEHGRWPTNKELWESVSAQ